MLIFIPYSSIWNKIFGRRVFYYLSTLSFGLYLWHDLFLALAPRLGLISRIDNAILKWAVIVGVSYAAALLVATASWKLLEKPIIAWSHKF
jgi:peptidoglycan/LPS O-acetylase OafA/YrhL